MENKKIKAMTNEEIRNKRKELNKKLNIIHKLIQEGRFSDAEREAKDIIKTGKSSKPFKSDDSSFNSVNIN